MLEVACHRLSFEMGLWSKNPRHGIPISVILQGHRNFPGASKSVRLITVMVKTMCHLQKRHKIRIFKLSTSFTRSR